MRAGCCNKHYNGCTDADVQKQEPYARTNGRKKQGADGTGTDLEAHSVGSHLSGLHVMGGRDHRVLRVCVRAVGWVGVVYKCVCVG